MTIRNVFDPFIMYVSLVLYSFTALHYSFLTACLFFALLSPFIRYRHYTHTLSRSWFAYENVQYTVAYIQKNSVILHV
jgi:hypothetical protein